MIKRHALLPSNVNHRKKLNDSLLVSPNANFNLGHHLLASYSNVIALIFKYLQLQFVGYFLKLCNFLSIALFLPCFELPLSSTIARIMTIERTTWAKSGRSKVNAPSDKSIRTRVIYIIKHDNSHFNFE